MTQTNPPAIETGFSKLLGCSYPIIAAPMFLVSNEALVSASTNAGGVGAAPSLNWRSAAQFDEALSRIAAQSSGPYAINLIVNKSNTRMEEDLAAIKAHKVPLVITSLGSPQKVIDAVRSYGGKVFCDVTTTQYALKVESQGADGVIAVCAGAGGHAGALSPFVFIPHLKENLRIPVVAAGGIVNGTQMFAALALGADAVQIGTRFINTTESPVPDDYKNAIIEAKPEDIVLTSRISGTPAAVINTPYIQKMGTDLSAFEKFLRNNRYLGSYAKMLRYVIGSKQLEQATQKTTWKNVWSAGQGAGLIRDVKPTADVMRALAEEYWSARNNC
jgi:nitronate monooxygenase